jgi:sugar lactone lactonase YvrE
MFFFKPALRTLGAALAVAALLSACGGSGSGTTTTVATGTSTLVGIAYDGSTNSLAVADSDGQVIRTVGIATSVVGVPAGTAFVAGSADGTGTGAGFNFPYGVARIGTDTYIADTGNHTIRKMTAAGVVTTVAGLVGKPGYVDGTGTAAQFTNPKGIATDGVNLYVSDSANNTVRQVTLAGVVTTVAGYPGQLGQVDATATNARFYNPFGLAPDGAGNLYVADSLNNTVRKIVLATGVVTTLAGSTATTAGSTDGTTGATSTFNGPAGIAVYNGFAYVSDAINYTIRKIDLNTGATTTLAGAAGSTGYVDAVGSAARFGKVYGVCSDNQGNLYVADSTARKIRKIEIATGNVTSLSPQF